jgi:transcriptional regulator with XRE-family HTH domain
MPLFITKGRQLTFLPGIDRAIIAAGSQEALADQLGVSKQAVQKWAARGYVPFNRAIEIEALYNIPGRDLIDQRLIEIVKRIKRK